MRLVILGRDGVINERVRGGVRSPEKWCALPGSLRAIARLTFARFHVVVATNQPGIGQGELDNVMLARIHGKMSSEVAAEGGHIDAIFYCPHSPDAGCKCRKPKPGLLQDIGRRLGMALDGVPVIGDSLDDVGAARAVGARPILVRTGRGRDVAERDVEGVEVFEDLAAAVAALTERTGAP